MVYAHKIAYVTLDFSTQQRYFCNGGRINIVDCLWTAHTYACRAAHMVESASQLVRQLGHPSQHE